ncbi:laccase [Schizopora paradoxa]|uniref:Laccase n=1 Tax=Schizopora paradoxa TaxID=27342 RepID=A0A0H2RGL3_9AGAM|nr:laccase [Schizopora paradoxa]
MIGRVATSLSLLAPIFLASSARAALVARDLHVQNKFLQPDGFNRSVSTADGDVQGPLLFGNVNDNFVINVLDGLTDPTMRRSTSIHWHGLFQAHTAEMDGPAFVTQCPIVPGHDFHYNFTAVGQSGTYWYHSHLSVQYCDGLRGPLVLYDPNDPLKSMYDIDDESTVITVADWYHDISTVAFPNRSSPVPTPDSTLINGQGRWSQNIGSPNPAPLAVVRAQPGKRHRYRLINMSCQPSYVFSIDGHKLTVIEADGVETEPVTVDSLEIFASQRYSIIVEANQPADNYFIRAIPSVGNNTTDGGVNSAILRYDGAPNVDPTHSFPNPNPVELNEADLHPIVNPGAPGEPHVGGVDHAFQLNITHNNGLFQLNGTSFIPPSVPVLLQILSGATAANKLLPSGAIIPLVAGDTYEINIPDGFPHPFHLHGHNFDVVRVAGSSTYNFKNPVRRDTVSIGSSTTDNVTFRFTANNPGPWFLHCHIDWHLEAGLALVFAEDAADIASNDPPNTDWDQLCPLYNQFNPDTGLSD